jgi:hypothetical protein
MGRVRCSLEDETFSDQCTVGAGHGRIGILNFIVMMQCDLPDLRPNLGQVGDTQKMDKCTAGNPFSGEAMRIS